MKGKYLCYLFFADLLAELIAIALRWDGVQLLTKPLLVIFLFAWFILSSIKFSPLRYCIAAALFFSWLGDVFLMMETTGNGWFMTGLGSFLLAHIMYILFFLRVRGAQQLPAPPKLFITLVVAFYVTTLFVLLYPHIGSLKIPVGIYACTIAVMLLSAVHSFGKKDKNAARYCITGAALFVISDSLLALNKFYHSYPSAGIWIMLTYGLAQFAITKGSLLYLADEKPGPSRKSAVVPY